MTTYIITCTDSLGNVATYPLEIVEDSSGLPVLPVVETIEITQAIMVVASMAIAQPLELSEGIAPVAEMRVAPADVAFVQEVEPTAILEIGAETPIGGGGGGGAPPGESKIIDLIAPGGDSLFLENDDFDWPTGTIVHWTTTGTLPSALPPITLNTDYYMEQQFFAPQYRMYSVPGFEEINFLNVGSGTHTLTSQ